MCGARSECWMIAGGYVPPMGTFICCFCYQDTDDVDYVQMDVYAPEQVPLSAPDGIREQTLGAHASCFRRAMTKPDGTFYIDVPAAPVDASAAEVRDRYRRDSAALMKLGAELVAQRDAMPSIPVSIPRVLAEMAVKSWEWEQPEGYETFGPASPQERLERGRSATLAMIGMKIEHDGVWRDDHVEVALDPWHLGLALEASDDAEDGDD